MASVSHSSKEHQNTQPEKRFLSIFDLPTDFFDSSRLIPLKKQQIFTSNSPSSIIVPENPSQKPSISIGETQDDHSEEVNGSTIKIIVPRWSCNSCKEEFESLQDQRSHFKSDFHRFNVKLIIAGKDIIKEEDFDELTSDFKDFDISSISGSEDEAEKGSHPTNDVYRGFGEASKNKLNICLHTGEKVSVWKCLLLDESDNISYENDSFDNDGHMGCLKESVVIETLKKLIREPRDKSHLRVILLASGGHFAGCVFDGTSVLAHKTFHRYVVRAKAGKKQSSKDASGKAASSAGASLRRYNELALKKEIQELFAAWKPYFDASSCVYIHAPSDNRQLLFNREKPYFSQQHCSIRYVPMTVRRPTFKEVRRIYNQLTQVVYELGEKESLQGPTELSSTSVSILSNESLMGREEELVVEVQKISDEPSGLSDDENEVTGKTTVLHEAAKCGDVEKILELLEEGLDPCAKDEKGRTPYMVANEKEARNTFRRFMASNIDKWDWHVAKVPSALTKEMEEIQATKQAEKDAKRKARAKELKKLRKEKEKKAQAEAALSQSVQTVPQSRGATLAILKGQPQSSSLSRLSKEEELKRAQAEEREKRAAAAEKRLAAVSSSLQGVATEGNCSCCQSSLVGKVPFHRYYYNYCSSSCMHAHRQILEDG